MKRKRHTPHEVARKLREAEVLEGQGRRSGRSARGSSSASRRCAGGDLMLDKQTIEEALRGRPQGTAHHKD